MLGSAKTLPAVLRAWLTWDQGPEMRYWKQVAFDADSDTFFGHLYGHRATNENTVRCGGGSAELVRQAGASLRR